MCRCKKLHGKNKIDTANIGGVKNANIGIQISADFTKIVKYLMIAGVLIVAIIFGTETYKFALEHSTKIEED